MGKCDAGSGSCFPLVFLSPSLSGQMPDAVTLAPGSCLPLVSLCLPVSASAVRCEMLGCEMLTLSLRSDARCCDAGSGVVSPACLPVSPSLSPCVSQLVSLCLPVSAVRCKML